MSPEEIGWERPSRELVEAAKAVVELYDGGQIEARTGMMATVWRAFRRLSAALKAES